MKDLQPSYENGHYMSPNNKHGSSFRLNYWVGYYNLADRYTYAFKTSKCYKLGAKKRREDIKAGTYTEPSFDRKGRML